MGLSPSDLRPLPKVELGQFPTPLHRASRLGEQLGLPSLWLKRDDLTGFSWGGNKVRTAEYLLGDAVANGMQELVISGGPSSNFVALMSAAAATVGITVHQVSYGYAQDRTPAAHRVARQFGATVTYTQSDNRDDMDELGQRLAAERSDFGRRAQSIPRGGATAVGSIGFVVAAMELERQLRDVGVRPHAVVMPVGSGGSVAGLLAGAELSGSRWELIGASVSRSPRELRQVIVAKALACAELAGHTISPGSVADRLTLHDARGAGFGQADAELHGFADGLQSATGLLMDLVYNAKALWWLRQHGEAALAPASDSPVIYWFTGGGLGAIDRLGISPSPHRHQD